VVVVVVDWVWVDVPVAAPRASLDSPIASAAVSTARRCNRLIGGLL
jgi:hypothetical protein